MKVGIFGGTFDPPHLGHLIAAQDALDQLSLELVLFIPALVPPHKQDARITNADVRLQMIRAATAGNTRFQVSDLELKRTGPSYTVETLRQLRSERPHDEFFLLLGVDQIREFSTWREPEEVLQYARVVMLARSGVEEPLAGSVVHENAAVTRVDISSTLVRQRVAAGRSVRYIVPDPVEKIIAAERLYSGGLG